MRSNIVFIVQILKAAARGLCDTVRQLFRCMRSLRSRRSSRELKCVGKYTFSVGTHMRGLGDGRSRVSLSTRAIAAFSPPEKEGLKRKIALFSASHE